LEFKTELIFLTRSSPLFPPTPGFSPLISEPFLCLTEKKSCGVEMGRKGLERAATKKWFSVSKCEVQYDAINLKMKIVVQLVKLFISDFSASSYLNPFSSYPP
jgi:hypothetical protein